MEGVSLVRGPVVEPGEVRVFSVFGGSTRVSTIPGISIAGPSPEATLWTPTLDLEYLVAGKPLSLNVVPVSPEGLPTPAVISRALLPRIPVSLLVVDSGLSYPLKVSHARLPSARPGGRIDLEPGLGGSSKAIFEEARLLGRWLAGGGGLVLGETIPGGTTTAAAIMTALGIPGVELVSSSSAENPKELKRRVVDAALGRAAHCGDDVFCVLDEVGDPVHVVIAGSAAGALEKGVPVVLAGGTQMGAPLAILRRLGYEGRIMIATTPWIVADRGAGIERIAAELGAGLAYAKMSFADAPRRGLRMYEEGYVKEGVGAGGALYLAAALLGVEEAKRLIYEEYEVLASGGMASED